MCRPFCQCMDERTGPNNCTGTSWYGGTKFWSVFYLVRSVVRNFSPKFNERICGTEFRSGKFQKYTDYGPDQNRPTLLVSTVPIKHFFIIFLWPNACILNLIPDMRYFAIIWSHLTVHSCLWLSILALNSILKSILDTDLTEFIK